MTTQSLPGQERADPSAPGAVSTRANEAGHPEFDDAQHEATKHDGGKKRIHWSRWGWVPYLLIAAFVGFWAATHTGAVVSGAGSWRAVAFGIAAGVLALGLLVGVARLTRRGWAGQLAGLVPLIAAVAVAVLPSYLPSTVNEAAPDGLADAPPAASGAPEADTGAGSAPTGAPADQTAAPGAESPAPELEPEPAPNGPIEVSASQFVGIDHEAAGTARLIQLEDGSLIVRFEQFSVESGPDYDVYVIPGANVSVPQGGTFLGDLKGTVGDQNYEIPADALPPTGEPVTVLIWCEIFAVPVANATF